MWRDLLSPRVWLMSSGGTGVATGSTPRSPAILACSVEMWPWPERSRSGNPVLQPNVGSSSGLFCVIDVGLRTDWSIVVCCGPQPARSAIRSRSPSLIFCLVVCWQGQCGPLAYAGGTERTAFRRRWPGLWTGCVPGMEGRMIYMISRQALPLCAGACGGTAMILFLRGRRHPLGMLFARFLWRQRCEELPVSLRLS
jgi:hypothetical protein